jgi:hypothetical protein
VRLGWLGDISVSLCSSLRRMGNGDGDGGTGGKIRFSISYLAMEKLWRCMDGLVWD